MAETPVHVKIAVGLAGPYITTIMARLQEYRVRCVRCAQAKADLPPIPKGVPYKVARSIQRLAALGAWGDGPEQVFPHNIPLPPGNWRVGINGFMVSTDVPYRRLLCMVAEPLAREPDEKRIAHLSRQGGEWVFTYWAKEKADGKPTVDGAEAPGEGAEAPSEPVPGDEQVPTPS